MQHPAAGLSRRDATHVLDTTSVVAHYERYLPFPMSAEDRAKAPPLRKELVDWPKTCALAHSGRTDPNARRAKVKAEAEARRAGDWVSLSALRLATRLDDKLRCRRARSCLGGRRRPGRRSSTRAASRSAGGGDPDEPGPGERGTKYRDQRAAGEPEQVPGGLSVAAVAPGIAAFARRATERAS
jgi:hypothetical protein